MVTHRAPEVSGAFLYEEDLIRKESRVPLLALADDRLQSKLVVGFTRPESQVAVYRQCRLGCLGWLFCFLKLTKIEIDILLISIMKCDIIWANNISFSKVQMNPVYPFEK